MHKNKQRKDWDTDMLYTSMYLQGYVDVHSMSVSLCSFLCNPYITLKYTCIVRCDFIQNLFLGTGKQMLHLWKDGGFPNNSAFEKIQEQIDSILPPSNVGRILSKISVGFAGFTAKQRMCWKTLYSPIALQKYLPLQHYTHWCLYSKACSLMCRTYIEMEQADELLMRFVQD